MTGIGRRPIPETPAGYLARARAAYKIQPHPEEYDRPAAMVGEFLHNADIEGA